MIELSPDELEEIERKVARFRDMVTNAAIRRRMIRLIERPERYAKRHAAELLRQPAVQIQLLERLISGESFKKLAVEHKHSPSYLSSLVWDMVRDLCEPGTSFWDRGYYRATLHQRRTYWWPLALKCLKEQSEGCLTS